MAARVPIPNVAPLVALAAPNPDLENRLDVANNELALFQNAPAMPELLQYLQQRQQQRGQILQQLGVLTDTVNLLVNAVNANQAKYAFFSLCLLTCSPPHRLDRSPMQLFNAAASSNADIMYPPPLLTVSAHRWSRDFLK